MNFGNHKITSGLFCILLMTQSSLGFFSQHWNIRHFPPLVMSPPRSISQNHICNHPQQVLEDARDKYDYRIVWHYNAALCHTQLGVFWPIWGWDMAWDRPDQQAYWTQQNFLTNIANLVKLQDIENSSQANRLIDQFCWIWLLKLTRNGLFHPNFDLIVAKGCPLLKPNLAKLADDAKSQCQW